MIHLNYTGSRLSLEIERTQVVAAANAVFLRVTTKAQEISPSIFAPIRESSRRQENRWQVDGINHNLSCRNVEFVTVNRRPLTTQLLVDIYFPVGQAIDVSFQQYQPSEGNFIEEFTGTPRVAERQTGVFPRTSGTGRQNQHRRPVALPNVPREMRDLVAQDLFPTEREMVPADAVTLSAPSVRTVVPDISEIPQPPPEAQFLRRFDNMVTDDGTEEITDIDDA